MLTYRQLLEKCNRKTLLDILYSKSLEDQFYKGGDPKEFEIKAQLNLEGYKQVIDAVLTKPVSEPKLSLVLSVGTDEQYDDKTFKPTGTLIHYVIVSFFHKNYIYIFHIFLSTYLISYFLYSYLFALSVYI